MKNKSYLFLLALYAFQYAVGQNLRQISSREDISNNAVLSLCQDRNGYIWLGTCDGLNLWDGNEMQLFQPKINKANYLSGNLIEEITETKDGLFWIRTNYGLDKFNPRDKSVERHTEFEGMYKFTVRKSNEVFVILQNNKFYYYNKKKHQFQPVNLQGVNYTDILDFIIGDDDNLYFFSRKGILFTKITFSNEGDFSFGKMQKIQHPFSLEYAHNERGRVYFVDGSKALYEFDLPNKQIIYKKNLQKEIAKRGKISSIIKDNDDYIIAFLTNGVIRLKAIPESSIKYVVEPIDIHCGVFSLLKDKNQEIIWIGTDGQGLFQCTKDAIAFKSITYDNLPFMISKPVRALFLDKENTLWIGTKDDGILRISDFYNCEKYTAQNTIKITAENSLLINNSVYAFAQSRKNLLWIGGDGPGINYYSYKDKSIHVVPSCSKIKYTHALQEINDSTLWIATVGDGIYKATIGGTKDKPIISKIIPIHINEKLAIKNFFFTLYQENDSIIWFGNRGEGAVRYNTWTNKSRIVKFSQRLPLTANDVFSIYQSKDKKMWFGTSSGLIAYSNYNHFAATKKNINILLTHNLVHGILEDNKHHLWLSTNRGLIEYSPNNDNLVTYGYSYGLNTIEYSDGAYFRDEKNDVMFFGGINGFVTVTETSFKEPNYNPPLLFKDIRINEEIFSISNMLKDGVLNLKHNQNFFTLSISALDYINGSNYSYLYKLEGYNEQWINNFNLNKLSFTSLPPGSYLLHVRYHNNTTGIDSSIYDLRIKILSPWYATIYAKILYLMLILLILGTTIRYYALRYKRKKVYQQQKLEQAQKEEVYESKLRFFTNITRELSAPLTLICGPCQQILGYDQADHYVKDYASTIQRNVSKLNELIFILNKFRGLGNIEQKNEIELLSVTQISHEITQEFTDYSQNNYIHYHLDIEDNLIWPSDRNGLSTILNTLLSYAFKHTPDSGEVQAVIQTKEEKLFISISNTGTGIKSEELERIFDRYRVLDYFEEQSEKGISSRIGLELAICYNTVTKMQGTITVESTPDDMTTFSVKLPRLEISKELNTSEHIIVQDKTFNLPIITKKEYAFDKNRLTMFIINENPEILNFVADLFAAQYNVHVFNDTQETTEVLMQTHPNIIICGIMSQSSSVFEFVKQIKQEKQTSHIPVILLSATQQKNEQLKGIESGADICLVLPFDVEYLKAVTEQLLKKNQSLKDYYKSSLSSFELIDGQMLHRDDKEFIDKMLKIISDNISNTTISTEFVADAMGISIRNLYRRLNGITTQTPVSIIKEYRLHIAEQFLVSTKLSIDEIIYKSGFSNRGTFFKCFAAKYNCTPKIYRERKMEDMTL